MSEIRIIDVPLGRVSAFQAKVTDLAKRAKRLSVEPIVATETGRRTERRAKVVNDGLVEICVGQEDVTIVTYEVTGETPRLEGGWTLLGVLEFTEGGVLVHGDALADYRTSERTCDHCKTKRARAKVAVAISESGQIMRVGTTCLRDAFGFWGTPEQALFAIEGTDSLEDEDWFGERGSWEPTTLEFLTVACAAVEARGFKPTSFAAGSTMSEVGTILRPPVRMTPDERALIESVTITEAHAEQAKAIIAWGQNLDGNDYLHNLGVVLRCDIAQKWGLLASAPKAFGADAEREARRAEQDAMPKADAPEGRVAIEGTVVSTRIQSSDFGDVEKMLVVCDAAAGQFKVWVTVPAGLDTVKPGNKVQFTATLTPSDDDKSFAFGSRPAKACLVEVAA